MRRRPRARRCRVRPTPIPAGRVRDRETAKTPSRARGGGRRSGSPRGSEPGGSQGGPNAYEEDWEPAFGNRNLVYVTERPGAGILGRPLVRVTCKVSAEAVPPEHRPKVPSASAVRTRRSMLRADVLRGACRDPAGPSAGRSNGIDAAQQGDRRTGRADRGGGTRGRSP